MYAMIKVADLQPNSYNPNVVDEKTMTLLKNDVARIGIQQPILVRPDPSGEAGKYIIIDGEHRYIIAKENGIEEVPCIVHEVDVKDAMVMTISMNKLRGEFDEIKLAEVLKSLQEQYSAEEINNLLGFTETELQQYNELLDFDLTDLDNGESEVPGLDPEEADIPLDNEFAIPVTYAQLDIIESFILADGKETESKTDVLVRTLEELLRAKYPAKWEEVQARKAELNDVEENPDPIIS